MLNKIKGAKPLLLLAVTLPLLTLGGCATRESVRNAQASANAADMHAIDARGRADRAQARADEAAGIGNNALTAAQAAQSSSDQKTAQLQADLDKANAKIRFLQRNVVYKPVKHKKLHHKLLHKKPAAATTPNPASGM